MVMWACLQPPPAAENEEDERPGAVKIYRTTYMFSATMPLAVERLAKK